MHAARERLELLVRGARGVVVVKVLPGRERRRDRHGVALGALVGERRAGAHGDDVGAAVLSGQKEGRRRCQRRRSFLGFCQVPQRQRGSEEWGGKGWKEEEGGEMNEWGETGYCGRGGGGKERGNYQP